MTKVTFLDSTTIEVVAKDGEIFTLRPLLPVPERERKEKIAQLLAHYFEEEFSDDKAGMVYWVLMKMFGIFSFSLVGSDRSAERERIGARIRQLRESKGFDANKLAVLAGIDAANLCRIEQGKYSVGIDILSKIATALGVKVDLV
jgi:DNA-binding XRE family transcriptional regulator